jgi:FixJ family two-component response regulator
MISDELDISKATVETTYKKAMERLKRHSKSLKNLSLQF